MSIRSGLENTGDRLSVALVIFAYNQEKYIEEAVKGALAQTFRPLHVVVSDDSSTDRTFGTAANAIAAYSGPHKAECIKTPRNLGLLEHINYVISRIDADIIVMAAGDDFSMPHRAQVIADIFHSAPNAMAVCSNWTPYDECDPSVRHKDIQCSHTVVEKVSIFDIMGGGGGVYTGATYAYRRQCFMWPEPLPNSLANEDRILPLRASLLGDVSFVREPLVRYRVARNIDKNTNERRMLALFRKDHTDYILRTLELAVLTNKISSMRAKFLFSILQMHRLGRKANRRNYTQLHQIPMLICGKLLSAGLSGVNIVRRRRIPR